MRKAVKSDDWSVAGDAGPKTLSLPGRVTDGPCSTASSVGVNPLHREVSPWDESRTHSRNRTVAIPNRQSEPRCKHRCGGGRRRRVRSEQRSGRFLEKLYQRALIEGTTTALWVLTDKNVDYNELSAACRLLLDRGSDLQFEEYLKVLRESKVHNVSRYSQLWHVAWEGKSPRVVRILAVVLDDERVESQDAAVRYCDFAAAVLQRFSGQDFGITQWDKITLPERNAAVARARGWMKQAGAAAR
jgi:hypothetical protein